MLYIIRITRSTLPLLTVLNGGVEPKIEYPETYMVLSVDPEVSNTIISNDEYFEKYFAQNTAVALTIVE